MKQARIILESTKVEIQAIEEYNQLKAELSKYRLSSEDPDKLLTLLNNIRYRYEKIVADVSRLNSLRSPEYLGIIAKYSKNVCQEIDKYYRSSCNC